jgi:hypothetical protein
MDGWESDRREEKEKKDRRDGFARAAAEGLLAHYGVADNGGESWIANRAVECADELIAQLDKEEE